MPKALTKEDFEPKPALPSEAAETVEPKETEETPATATEGAESTATEQDPLKEELEKVQQKTATKRTKKEKLEFTRDRVLKELADLDGGEGTPPAPAPEDDDDTPLTRGDLRKMQEAATTKTALQLAEDITNETERELVKYHIDNTIKPSGDPATDLKIARSIVNAVKNEQILKQAALKPEAQTHSSDGGAPARHEPEIQLTPEEIPFSRPPFNLTKADILAKRPKK